MKVTLCKRGVMAAVIAMCLLSTSAARAQFSPPVQADLLRNNPKIIKLFTIVAADGWVITKASELKLHGKNVVRLKDGCEYDAKVVGVKDDYDLALLKIDAEELKPIIWRDSKEAKVGRWVASVAPGED